MSKCKHGKKTRLWCKIVFQINVEQTNVEQVENNGGTLTSIYTFLKI
jgi:hypothetical protein